MRRSSFVRPGWAAAAALLAAPAFADVQVALRDGRVDVAARSAPLAEVLDRLARQTQMQVTYEGAPPRQLVTAIVQSATPAQAVLSVLEGLGVNYALQLDATGQQVTTLLLIAPRSGSAPARPLTETPAVRVPPPPPTDDEPVVEEEEPVPADTRERPFRPGRERMERPGLFEPVAPGPPPVPAPVPAPAPSYPVSPFAPVAPPVQQVAPAPAPAPGTPTPPAQPDES